MRDYQLHRLSHPQKRVWYIEKLYLNTSLYNIGGVIRVNGEINFGILKKALNIFIEKNEGIRLRIIEDNGHPWQYAYPYQEIDIDLKDFSKQQDSENAFFEWSEKEFKKPFKLMNEALYYFAFFRIKANKTGYFLKFHHIIFDGWSVSLLTKEITELYNAIKNNENIEYSVRSSYLNYLEEESDYLKSSRYLNNKSFWNDKFKTLPDSSLINSSDNIKGNRKTFLLDKDRSMKIYEFIKKRNCSLNTFFIAIFLIYFYKFYNQKSLILGVPVFNRIKKSAKKTIGMYTSIMPFQTDIEENVSFYQFVSSLNRELGKSYLNQRYPYDHLIEDLKLRRKGFSALFDLYVNYYNTKLPTRMDGFDVENEEYYNGNQIYSLQLVIKEWLETNNVIINLDYKVADFSDEEISTIYHYFIRIVDQVLLNDEIMLQDIELLTEDEKKHILQDFNNTTSVYPKNKTVIELFKERVQINPDKIAIEYKNTSISYKELDQRSNDLANYLKQIGVVRHNFVGIIMSYSNEVVITVLAVLKTGAAYVPMDPTIPQKRMDFIIQDTALNVVITNFDETKFNYDPSIKVINTNNINEKNNTILKSSTFVDDLAYMIYTSGSTGNPKGVMVTHQNLMNYIFWAQSKYIESDNEVFALYTSLAFDLTVTSLFTPLISGSKIKIYSDDESEYVLYRIINEAEATIVKLTPSHLSLLRNMELRNSSIKSFIVGGENFKCELAKDIYYAFGGNIKLFNEYGPTEATVGCMIYQYTPDDDIYKSVPIGKPSNNCKIYIVDKQLSPVPIGATGEILISGDGVAKGYWNNKDMISRKFFADPFNPDMRAYRTGDFGRFKSENTIEYLGRADDQIKIRGHRIELGEIEKHLLDFSRITNATVICKTGRKENDYLIAYVIASRKTTSADVKTYLKNILPDYMIPQDIVFLNEIPLTSNGKIDKEQLQQLDYLNEKREHEIPSTEKEKVLCYTIMEVLGLEKISLNDNFYILGGDSVKAIQVSSKLHNLNYKIKARDILSTPVISEMASYVSIEKKIITDQSVCEGIVEETPIFKWFFSRKFKNPCHYNQSVLLKLKYNILNERLNDILIWLIKHHDTLRLNYDEETSRLFYNAKHLNINNVLEIFDLEKYSDVGKLNKIKTIGNKLKSSFDIKNSLLLKCGLFLTGTGEKYLLLIAHHLVIDGVSWRILIEDLKLLIEQATHNENLKLPLKTVSYSKWASLLFCYNKKVDVEKELDYWQQTNEYEACLAEIHFTDEITVDKAKISLNLSYETTGALLHKANIPYKTKANELLLMALALTIKDIYKIDKVLIELEGHGRNVFFENLDISRTCGWFTSIYPVKLDINTIELDSFIKSIKEQLRKVPNNGFGYGIHKFINNKLARDNNKLIRFNYLGEFDYLVNNEYFDYLEYDSGDDVDADNHLTCLFEINALVINKQLKIDAIYNNGNLKSSIMNSFIDIYKNNIIRIVDFCSNKEVNELTPSDFDTVNLSQNSLDSFFT